MDTPLALEYLTTTQVIVLLGKSNLGVFAQELRTSNVDGALLHRWLHSESHGAELLSLRSGSGVKRRQLLKFLRRSIRGDLQRQAVPHDATKEIYCPDDNLRASDDIEAEAIEFVTELFCHFGVVCALMAVYHRILVQPCEYTNFDDPENFVHNHHIHSITSDNIWWIFAEGQVLGVYEPVANLFKLLWGVLLGVDATMALRCSVCLHVVNACSALLLTEQLLAIHESSSTVAGGHRWTARTNHRCRWWSAAAGVLVVSLHPLRVEVVAWPSAQPYLLATCFALLSCAAHVHHRQTSQSGWSASRVTSLAALVLASLCKAPAIALPAVLLCFDLWFDAVRPPRTNEGRRASDRKALISVRSVAALLWAHAATVAVAAATLALAWGPAQTQGMRTRELRPVERFTRAVLAPAWYAQQTAAPAGLSVVYPVPDAPLLFWVSPFAAPCAVTLFLTAVAASVLLSADSRGRWGEALFPRSVQRAALAGSLFWTAYLGLLLPTSGLVTKHIWGLAADRYCYLPALILGAPAFAAVFRLAFRCISLSPGISGSGSGGSNGSAIGASAAAIAATAVASAWIVASARLSEESSSRTWASSEHLWRYTARVQPQNAFVLNNLAATLSLRSRLEESETAAVALQAEAEELFEVAYALAPDYADLIVNFAAFRATPYRSDRYDEVLAIARRGAELLPVNPQAQHTVGVVQHAYLNHYHPAVVRGVPGGAREALSEASPLRRVAETVAQNYENAWTLSSDAGTDAAEIVHHYAMLLGNHLGRHSEAASVAARALRLAPLDVRIQLTLAEETASMGRDYWDTAAAHYAAALKRAPADVPGRVQMAGVLGNIGRLTEAAWNYGEVLRQAPSHAGAMCGLGSALLSEGRAKEAVHFVERGVRLEPKQLDVFANVLLQGLEAVGRAGEAAHWRKNIERRKQRSESSIGRSL